MTDAPLMALSSAVEEPKKFLLDGVEYQLFSTDHISPQDEAYVMALLSRHNILTRQLATERNVARGKHIAEEQRKARIEVIARLTSVPRSQATTLPISVQVKLLEAISDEVAVIDGDEDLDVLQDEEEEDALAAGAADEDVGESY